jgi:hypothetical protein
MAQRLLLTMRDIGEPMSSGHGRRMRLDYQPFRHCGAAYDELGFPIIKPPHNRKMLFALVFRNAVQR